MKKKFEALTDWLHDQGIKLRDILLFLGAVLLIVWAFTAFTDERRQHRGLEEEVDALEREMRTFEFPAEGSLPQNAPLVKVTAAVTANSPSLIEDPAFGVRAEGLKLSRNVAQLVKHKKHQTNDEHYEQYEYSWERIEETKAAENMKSKRRGNVPEDMTEEQRVEIDSIVKSVIKSTHENQPEKSPPPKAEQRPSLAQKLQKAPHVLKSRDFWAEVRMAGLTLPPDLLKTLSDEDAQEETLKNFSWPPDEAALQRANAALGDPMSLGYRIFQEPPQKDGTLYTVLFVSRHQPKRGNSEGDLKIRFTRLPPIASSETWTVFAALKNGQFVPADFSAPLNEETVISSVWKSKMSRTWKVWRQNISAEEAMGELREDIEGHSLIAAIFFGIKLVIALGMLLRAAHDIRENRW